MTKAAIYNGIIRCELTIKRGAKTHELCASGETAGAEEVRQAFWQAWRDGIFKGVHVTPKRITNYSGNGKMHNTDTRCAFCDFVDDLSKSGQLKEGLAERVTLS